MIGYHHRPWELPEHQRALPMLVHVADVLAAQLDLGYSRTVESRGLSDDLLGAVHLAQADLDDIVAALPDAVQKELAVFDEA